MTTTVFTSCNRGYEPFAVPHIISTLFHNEDMAVEICVEAPDAFVANNKSAIELLAQYFPDRVLIRAGKFAGVTPNSVRFLEEPKIRSESTYISDIDILVLRGNITGIHTEHMRRTGLPYSNVLRPNTERLTGLHFTTTAAHYPLVVPGDIDLKGNDERVLYRLVVSKGLPLPDPADTFRPIHGYHVSLNRVPHGAPETLDWGLSRGFLKPYLRLISSDVWQDVLPYFHSSYRVLLQTLDATLQTQFPDRAIYRPSDAKLLFRNLRTEATGVTTAADITARKAEEAKRDNLISEKRFADAIEFQQERLSLAPSDAVLHHQMAWLCAAVRDFESALVHERMASMLAPGNQRYANLVEKYRSAWQDGVMRLPSEALGQADPNHQAEVDTQTQSALPLSRETVSQRLGNEETAPDRSVVFNAIHDENRWRGTSKSGPGSSLAATELLRAHLLELFDEFGVRSLCDAACGDAGWIGEITSRLENYHGFDLVEELVEQNSRRLQHPKHAFAVLDIAEEILPRADAILCRDCLVHLPLDTGVDIVNNFKRSGSRYLLATTFPTVEVNRPSGIGGWRPLNMMAAPFNFPEPLRLLRERRHDPSDPYNDKSIGVWLLSEVAYYGAR